ncbi:bacterial methyltransferase [Linderina pennispora]|uniref:Bacterial methyltransferase n=1 Tax=Linderina pennispora TaxID=61395 RepID=A0A1Y1W0T6_9FUNG|nr:bacterial methyltransferase [Linderina pennispora]ORX67117.1 bacterial methyltransferase [Linderina pennispora]
MLSILPRLSRSVRSISTSSQLRTSPPPFPYERIHTPVMLNEVIQHLSPQDGKTYLDGTVRRSVTALDQDPTAIDKAERLAAFLAISVICKAKFDGIVLDIGVSSSQIASEDRGFSFQLADSPLDMRMSYSQEHGALTRLLPAHAIVNQFSAPITTTGELVEAVLAAVPKSYKWQIHPATRVFQSLRIEVNDELGQLDRALDAAVEALNPGGRLVVVSFHSLEDAVVKKRFRAWTDSEAVSENPRARSAKLRAIEVL